MSEHNGPVLVTGANGHLGRRLLQRLSGKRDLVAVVRSERARGQIDALSLEPAPRVVVLDYADEAALAAAASGCSHAVHLVGILKEGPNSRYADAHEASARALAGAAASAGLRRVVLLSILGSHPDATNACLASKGRGERILLDATTPALVLRVPMVLGEGDFASRALGRRARSSRVAMVRGGRSLEQPIYAGDVIEACVTGVSRDGLDDLALDLAGPESLSARQLAERAAAVLGLEPPGVLPVPAPLQRVVVALLETLLRDPPVTRAMLGVLEHDDAVDVAPTLARLDLSLTPLDETLRLCLSPENPR